MIHSRTQIGLSGLEVPSRSLSLIGSYSHPWGLCSKATPLLSGISRFFWVSYRKQSGGSWVGRWTTYPHVDPSSSILWVPILCLAFSWTQPHACSRSGSHYPLLQMEKLSFPDVKSLAQGPRAHRDQSPGCLSPAPVQGPVHSPKPALASPLLEGDRPARVGQQSLSCSGPGDEHSAVHFTGALALVLTISTSCGREQDAEFLTSRAQAGWADAAGSNDMYEVSPVV